MAAVTAAGWRMVLQLAGRRRRGRMVSTLEVWAADAFCTWSSGGRRGMTGRAVMAAVTTAGWRMVLQLEVWATDALCMWSIGTDFSEGRVDRLGRTCSMDTPFHHAILGRTLGVGELQIHPHRHRPIRSSTYGSLVLSIALTEPYL